MSSEGILKGAQRNDSKNSPFKRNSILVQHSPELVQRQYKEAEEEEKEVVVGSLTHDVADSKLTENEIPQQWTLPKHNASRGMQSFSKFDDNED
ncbi:hypothetical protein GQX74_009680 [Glossina fuscipes]|uniref:Uncharacterized protein n=1 Tax=Glossina palpalis gambiensis TaxID=67801 RepID=A0A1B0BWS1_9MUSC|nr:hypothetical protein GQX74_009680 [Glossina fuscipes]